MESLKVLPGSEWDQLVRSIVRASVRVHSAVGPGFLESIYHKGLIVELTAGGLHCSSEVEVPISYRGVLLGRHRLDLVVGAQAIVELKVVHKLDQAHFAQVRSYLAASALPVGLLVNFSGPKVECRRVYSMVDRVRYQGLRALRVSASDHLNSDAVPVPPEATPAVEP